MELSPYQRILLDRAENLAPPQERPRRYGRRRHPDVASGHVKRKPPAPDATPEVREI